MNHVNVGFVVHLSRLLLVFGTVLILDYPRSIIVVSKLTNRHYWEIESKHLDKFWTTNQSSKFSVGPVSKPFSTSRVLVNNRVHKLRSRAPRGGTWEGYKQQDGKVFEVAFPKTGTSSISEYFANVLHLNTIHYGEKLENKPTRNIGREVCENGHAGRKLLHGWEKYQAFAQIDVLLLQSCGPKLYKGRYGARICLVSCWPQITHLRQLHFENPNSAYILNWRDPLDWVESINHWKNIRGNLAGSEIPGLYKKQKYHLTDEELVGWMFWHAERVLDLCKSEAMNCLFLEIDKPHATATINSFFNANGSLGHANTATNDHNG
mmetsp:Transcript_15179/g.20952  ORF Transcript_15179/g.20952 Transcript_15179/m.20952 type:complete len:321 (-) Transcript_15179:16-978(-)